MILSVTLPPPPPKSTRWFNPVLRIALLCALLTLALHIPWLGTPPLAGTEAHRALTAHQMVERGDWSVPMLYGRVYLRKPPLQYWVLATAESVTGQANTWVWRMPTAFWAAGTTFAVAWFAGIWFGQTAALCGGVLQAGMIALWPQSRSCDIDGLNTLLAGMTAMCWFQLMSHASAWRWWLACVTGLLLTLTLLAKGPAGLPPVVAVVLVCAAGARWRDLSRTWLAIVMPTAIACLLVACGVYMMYTALVSRGLPLDFSGLDEAASNLYDTRASRLLQAALLPPTLLAYALPASGFLVISAIHRQHLDRRARQLLICALVSWLVCVFSGMVNPRYAYPTFPLVCVAAAGAVHGMIASACWSDSIVRRVLISSAFALPILAVPMAWLTLQNKLDRSGLGAAEVIRQAVGHLATTENPVLMGRMLRFQPELCYYAGVAGRSHSETLQLPSDIAPGTLILAAEDELQILQAAGRVEELGRFVSNKRQAFILRWLGTAPATAPASTTPTTTPNTLNNPTTQTNSGIPTGAPSTAPVGPG